MIDPWSHNQIDLNSPLLYVTHPCILSITQVVVASEVDELPRPRGVQRFERAEVILRHSVDESDPCPRNRPDGSEVDRPPSPEWNVSLEKFIGRREESTSIGWTPIIKVIVCWRVRSGLYSLLRCPCHLYIFTEQFKRCDASKKQLCFC